MWITSKCLLSLVEDEINRFLSFSNRSHSAPASTQSSNASVVSSVDVSNNDSQHQSLTSSPNFSTSSNLDSVCCDAFDTAIPQNSQNSILSLSVHVGEVKSDRQHRFQSMYVPIV